MIRLPSTIYVAMTPVNLHLSFDRLAGIVRTELGGDPRAEAAFVFHNRRGTHAKILWFDGTGYCIFYERLDHNVSDPLGDSSWRDTRSSESPRARAIAPGDRSPSAACSASKKSFAFVIQRSAGRSLESDCK
jgi:hypothetical protein